jgi:hypothetical protein
MVGVRVAGEGAIWVEDRTNLAVSRNMQQYVRSRMELETVKAEAAMPSLAGTLGSRSRARWAPAGTERRHPEHILDADTPSCREGDGGAQRGDAAGDGRGDGRANLSLAHAAGARIADCNAMRR